MKILWTKAGGVLPLDTGGRIRSFQTLKELARRHEITLHVFYEQFAGDQHASLGSVFYRVVPVPLRIPRRGGLQDSLLFARCQLSGQPYTMAKWYAPEVRRTIGQLLREERYDLVVCDFLHPAGVLPWPAPAPTALFTHNIEAEVWERQLRVTANPGRKLAYWLEYKALARAERRYIRLADHVLAVSERNADFIRRLVPAEKVSVAPTGVDTTYFQPRPEKESAEPELVFTASMDWMPNEDAALYFARDVFPLVRREVPQARFWAVGRNPSAAIRGLDDGAAVRVTGSVEDIRPYLDRAWVYVMPMRSGSGTRLKIFEAMAAGKAVVSTPMGAEGLPVADGEHLLLAESPAEFARATVGLLKDPDLRRRLGAAARRLTEGRFSWAAATAEFEAILCRVAGEGARVS
ncbi:MAG: glycosyltransferase [Bryobacteraceae bacterium]|nr:glycosyltransferase [Bryobacteraceae bacterium]